MNNRTGKLAPVLATQKQIILFTGLKSQFTDTRRSVGPRKIHNLQQIFNRPSNQVNKIHKATHSSLD